MGFKMAVQSGHRHHLENIRKLSKLLDSQYEFLGIKFGLDALIGLVPIVGDIVTTVLSTYIIIQAAAVGCSAPVLLRMTLNVIFENIVDQVPILGNVFDLFFRSNLKNLNLLERHLRDPIKTSSSSSKLIFVIVSLIVIATSGLIVAIGYAGYVIMRELIHLINDSGVFI